MAIETKGKYLNEICKEITEEIFGSDYDYDVGAQAYTNVPYDDKHMLIDNHVAYSMTSKQVIKLVSEYGVFNAIQLYQDTYGEFPIENITFITSYGTLAYAIIDEYINENQLLIEIDEDEEEDEEEEEVDDIL